MVPCFGREVERPEVGGKWRQELVSVKVKGAWTQD